VPSSAEAAPPGIKVQERKEGNTVYLDVTNPNLCELTVAVELTLQNLTAEPPGPIRLICPPQKTRTAVALRVTEPRNPSKYNYNAGWQWGSSRAKFNPSLTYMLPYAPGKRFRITQGHNGKLSHFGAQRFAIDFGLPRRTPVHAARAGKVVWVQDGFGDGKLK